MKYAILRCSLIIFICGCANIPKGSSKELSEEQKLQQQFSQYEQEEANLQEKLQKDEQKFSEYMQGPTEEDEYKRLRDAVREDGRELEVIRDRKKLVKQQLLYYKPCFEEEK